MQNQRRANVLSDHQGALRTQNLTTQLSPPGVIEDQRGTRTWERLTTRGKKRHHQAFGLNNGIAAIDSRKDILKGHKPRMSAEGSERLIKPHRSPTSFQEKIGDRSRNHKKEGKTNLKERRHLEAGEGVHH